MGIVGPSAGDLPSYRFVDFSVRAWREGPYIQVIAHSTPAGGMRQPVAVRIGEFSAEDYRVAINASLVQGAEVGRRLARLLLPDQVWRLLGESLQLVAPQAGLALRLRLCFDDDLIDLPWEFLYRPDVEALGSRTGFLLMDGRVSLVREPPSIVAAPGTSDRVQRGLFVGTTFDDDSDLWGVGVEYASLARSIRPLKSLMTLEFISADAPDEVERAVTAGCDLFHYAGHTETEAGRGVMVQRASARAMKATASTVMPHDLEVMEERASWAWGDNLAVRLARAGTKLAVFNACNSGSWSFVRPFMAAGVPAVVGVQGLVSNPRRAQFRRETVPVAGGRTLP